MARKICRAMRITWKLIRSSNWRTLFFEPGIIH
jgi:hypothetical protein